MRLAGGIVALALSLGVSRGQNPPNIQLSASSLTFQAVAGGVATAPQMIDVVSPDFSLFDFAVLADNGTAGGAAPGWLLVRTLRLTTPARIRVAADPSSLAPGTQTARLQLTDPQGRGLGIQIPITLQVTAGNPQVSTLPDHLQFVSSGNSQEQDVLVSNGTAAGLASATATVSAAWLKVSADPCQRDCLVRVTANPGGLQPGGYSAFVQIGTATGTKTVPVSLFVAPNGPQMSLDITGTAFEVRQGNGTAESRAIVIANQGNAPLNWTASVANGAAWLQLGNNSGVVPAGGGGSIALSATATTVPVGVYYALVRVDSPQAANAPQYVAVALRVVDSSTAPAPILSTAGFVFTAVENAGSSAPDQTMQLLASSTSALNYRAWTETYSGGSWLSVTPSGGGTTSIALPQTLSVSASSSGLSAGIYSGEINFTFGTTVFRTAGVTFVVTSASGSCVAGGMAATHVGLSDSFGIRVGTPSPVRVNLTDNCGKPVTNGQVVVAFSSGETGLRLSYAGNGVYAGTWVPQMSSTSLPGGTVTVTARAWAPNPSATAPATITATAELVGTVSDDTSGVPVVAANGVLNNLNPQAGAPLAPGTIVQVFGSALWPGAPLSTAFAGGKLPTAASGISVLVGDTAAPLYYLSNGQINAQLPMELTPNRAYQVMVTANGLYSAPQTIMVNSTAPAVAAYSDGRVIAQDSSGNLIDASHPARRGNYVVIYLVGMGITNPAVASGQQTPSTPLANAIAPSVAIGGQTASFLFAGLTPGFVGLYQMNVQVPSALSPGDAQLVVTQNGAASNPTILAVQ